MRRWAPMNRKKLFLTAALLSLFTLCSGTVFAMPALERATTMHQPDGTPVTLTQCGDEYMHWFEDESHNAVIRTSSGRYEYAKRDGKGGLAASGVMCRPDTAAPYGTARNFRPSGQTEKQIQQQRQMRYKNGDNNTGSSGRTQRARCRLSSSHRCLSGKIKK
jgi:hypothetical protein